MAPFRGSADEPATLEDRDALDMTGLFARLDEITTRTSGEARGLLEGPSIMRERGRPKEG
jgi:hypothetical protein